MKLLLTLTLAISVLLAACPQQRRGTSQHDPKTTQHSLDGARDLLAEALAGELPDERSFALLAISKFHLTAYREELTDLAATDPVAAVTLAAVSGEVGPAREYYISHNPPRRLNELLGSTFGMGCASLIPSELWLDLVSRAPEDELDTLLWGLAQLDVEPGGPIQLSDELAAALANRYAEATATDNITRQAALDAILGTTDGHAIGWAQYIDYSPDAHWNSAQWAALLRWAGADVWREVLLQPSLREETRFELARAVIKKAPAEVKLPGDRAAWLSIGADLEYRANQFMLGKADRIRIPELGALAIDHGEAPPTDEPTGAAQPELNQAALGAALTLLEYALVREESNLMDQVLDSMADLPEPARNGVLATIMRFRPAALTDDQLQQLISLDDRSVGFFLLLGWHDRAVVQESGVDTLVRVSPRRENIIVAEAYRRWLAQQQQ